MNVLTTTILLGLPGVILAMMFALVESNQRRTGRGARSPKKAVDDILSAILLSVFLTWLVVDLLWASRLLTISTAGLTPFLSAITYLATIRSGLDRKFARYVHNSMYGKTTP